MEEIVGVVANGRKEETWKISNGRKCATDLDCKYESTSIFIWIQDPYEAFLGSRYNMCIY